MQVNYQSYAHIVASVLKCSSDILANFELHVYAFRQKVDQMFCLLVNFSFAYLLPVMLFCSIYTMSISFSAIVF